MSDIERAAEFLGCEREEADCLGRRECAQHLTWPCSEVRRLAAEFAKIRSETVTKVADDFQWGGWIETLGGGIAARVANGTEVTAWLRTRAARYLDEADAAR